MRIHNKLHNIIQEEALQINSKLFRTSTLNYLQTKLLLCNINSLEIKPCGIGSRIQDVEAFWYKTEIKIVYFVRLCVIVWFTPTLKLKDDLIFFWGWLFFIQCYYPKHFQLIHWNKLFCRMYGLGVMLTMKTSKFQTTPIDSNKS